MKFGWLGFSESEVGSINALCNYSFDCSSFGYGLVFHSSEDSAHEFGRIACGDDLTVKCRYLFVTVDGNLSYRLMQ